MDGRKKCSKCCEWKAASDFHKSRRSPDGLQARCKICNQSSASEWNKKNEERYQEYNREYVKEWAKKNPKRLAERMKRRQVALKRATPPWLSAEQKLELALFYNNTPPGMVVDHVEPIQAKEVCGLHVPWNLQYLEKKENLKKRNSFKPYSIVHGGTENENGTSKEIKRKTRSTNRKSFWRRARTKKLLR
jgi:hypothetical protein